MVLAVGLWALHDAASKWLAVAYPIFVLLFWRSQFALIPMVVLVGRAGGVKRLSPRLLALCLLRGAIGFASFACFIFALPLMPFADAIAVGMSAPIFITALSVPVLSERVGPWRWAGVIAGFAGVLVIVRPSGDIPWDGAVLLLTSNVLYASGMMMTRRMARAVDTATFSFYGAGMFALLSAVIVPFVWVLPEWPDLVLLAACGLMAGIAQYVMTDAFRIATPSLLAPFEYTGIVWAVGLGYAIWGELPGLGTAIGIAIIVASGLYVLRRENLRGTSQ
jgi:drug/metabolite transporter (DMT)-like permease